jgi:hypothetical protein
MLKKIGLLEEEPLLSFKEKACAFIGLEISGREEADLIDLSSFDAEFIRKLPELMERKVLLSPSALHDLRLDKLDSKNIYVAFPFREWALVPKTLEMKRGGECGELTSMRITWLRSKNCASSEKEFLFNTLANILHISGFITESSMEQLYVEKVEGENNLFALAMFGGEIAVEIECNESLPASMENSHFIKANFTDGIVTNVPLVGHFNEEGSIYATDEKLTKFLVENAEWEGGDEMQNTYWQMLLSLKEGSYPQGALDAIAITDAIEETLKTGMPVNLGEKK